MVIIMRENNLYYNEKIDNTKDKIDYSFDEEQLKIKYELEKHASIAHMSQIVVSTSEKSIIGTTALCTCYGIVFYDRNNKFGMVGHAAPSKKRETLKEMIKMLGDEPRTIEYEIVVGYRNVECNDYTGVEELTHCLKVNCSKNIKLVPFQSDLGIQVCSNVDAYEFAFDVNTATPVGKYLFYDGKSLDKTKYR